MVALQSLAFLLTANQNHRYKGGSDAFWFAVSTAVGNSVVETVSKETAVKNNSSNKTIHSDWRSQRRLLFKRLSYAPP